MSKSKFKLCDNWWSFPSFIQSLVFFIIKKCLKFKRNKYFCKIFLDNHGLFLGNSLFIEPNLYNCILTKILLPKNLFKNANLDSFSPMSNTKSMFMSCISAFFLLNMNNKCNPIDGISFFYVELHVWELLISLT